MPGDVLGGAAADRQPDRDAGGERGDQGGSTRRSDGRRSRRQAVGEVEAVAKEARSVVQACGERRITRAVGRADAAVNAAIEALSREPDAGRRVPQFTRLLGPLETLLGRTGSRCGWPSPVWRRWPPADTRRRIAAAQAKGKEVAAEISLGLSLNAARGADRRVHVPRAGPGEPRHVRRPRGAHWS